MSKFISNNDRILKAKSLISQAYQLPIPKEAGKYNFSYIARVKALLQDARDLVKFIPKFPSATDDMKEEVKLIFRDCEIADQSILHK